MNLNNADLSIVEMALRRTIQELTSQMDGKGATYTQVWASAWHACQHCRARAEAVLAKIESRPADHMEKDDGNTAGR